MLKSAGGCSGWPARVAGAALVCVAVLASAAPARGAEPSPDDVAQARVLFDDGMKSAKAGRWKDAYASFAAAWKKKQHPQVAANLGRAAFRLKKYGEAAEFLSYFLRESTAISLDDRNATEAMLADAKSRAASVDIAVSRPGATVLVDDLPMGISPLGRAVLVDVGAHDLVARMDDGAEVRLHVDVARGKENRFSLAFPEEAPAVAVVPPKAVTRPVDEGEGAGGVDPRVVGAGIGLTALGVGLGIAGAVIASSRSDELDELEPKALHGTDAERARLRVEWADVDGPRTTWARIRTAAFIGASVTAIATVGYVLIAGREGTGDRMNSSTDIDIAVAPGVATIVVVERW